MIYIGYLLFSMGIFAKLIKEKEKYSSIHDYIDVGDDGYDAQVEEVMVYESVTDERPYNTAYGVPYDNAELDEIHIDHVKAHSQPKAYTLVCLPDETCEG